MKTSIIVLAFFASLPAFAQNVLLLPEGSQLSKVSQRIGITDIEVVYHSPAVKGRKIWGELVPEGELWRAGANENTTISFSTDVSIDGKPLAAGIYGLHMIPGKEEWTVIFSKNHTSWGSFFYRKDEDALRAQVKPEVYPFTEWLDYTFTDRGPETATLCMRWEKLSVPVRIDVDVKNTVLANIRNQLRSTPSFTWQGWYEAAQFCYNQKFNYEQALRWVEVARRRGSGEFNVLRLKAQLLEATGNKTSADSLMHAALPVAGENDMNTYGYELLNQGKTREAIGIFKANVKKYPKSWNAYDSLAEALTKAGEKSEALKQYEMALSKAPEEQRTRISSTIRSLKATN